MHPQHYQPKTPLFLGPPPAEGRGAYLWWSESRPSARSTKMSADPSVYAVALYGILHQLDTEGWDYIAVEPVPPGIEWPAFVTA